MIFYNGKLIRGSWEYNEKSNTIFFNKKEYGKLPSGLKILFKIFTIDNIAVTKVYNDHLHNSYYNQNIKKYIKENFIVNNKNKYWKEILSAAIETEKSFLKVTKQILEQFKGKSDFIKNDIIKTTLKIKKMEKLLKEQEV